MKLISFLIIKIVNYIFKNYNIELNKCSMNHHSFKKEYFRNGVGYTVSVNKKQPCSCGQYVNFVDYCNDTKKQLKKY